MKNRIFALGFFDGVHLGHQVLLRACGDLANAQNAETAAITFRQHPQSLFTANVPPLINTLEDRHRLLMRYGMTHIHSFPVSKEVMSTYWRDFLDNLVEHGAAGFVCGDDFRFGHKGQGNAEKLAAFCQEKGLPCIIVPEQRLERVRVSSTHIRRLIEAGDMENAGKFLGHPHILSGEVVSGQQLGRKLGIPTANLRLPDGVVCPKLGVYGCKAMVNSRAYLAVANIGTRPTVSGEGVTVEPWILDFNGDLYGQEITLEFHNFLRPEQKFESLEALKAQVQKDSQTVRTLLAE